MADPRDASWVQLRLDVTSHVRNVDMVTIMNLGAWAIAAALALWMIVDLVRTDRGFDEDYLLSSAEGEIVDGEVAESTARSE